MGALIMVNKASDEFWISKKELFTNRNMLLTHLIDIYEPTMDAVNKAFDELGMLIEEICYGFKESTWFLDNKINRLENVLDNVEVAAKYN